MRKSSKQYAEKKIVTPAERKRLFVELSSRMYQSGRSLPLPVIHFRHMLLRSEPNLDYGRLREIFEDTRAFQVKADFMRYLSDSGYSVVGGAIVAKTMSRRAMAKEKARKIELAIACCEKRRELQSFLDSIHFVGGVRAGLSFISRAKSKTRAGWRAAVASHASAWLKALLDPIKSEHDVRSKISDLTNAKPRPAVSHHWQSGTANEVSHRQPVQRDGSLRAAKPGSHAHPPRDYRRPTTITTTGVTARRAPWATSPKESQIASSHGSHTETDDLAHADYSSKISNNWILLHRSHEEIAAWESYRWGLPMCPLCRYEVLVLAHECGAIDTRPRKRGPFYELNKPSLEFVHRYIRRPRDTQLASSHGEITEGDDMPPKGNKAHGEKRRKCDNKRNQPTEALANELLAAQGEADGKIEKLREEKADLERQLAAKKKNKAAELSDRNRIPLLSRDVDYEIIDRVVGGQFQPLSAHEAACAGVSLKLSTIHWDVRVHDPVEFARIRQSGVVEVRPTFFKRVGSVFGLCDALSYAPVSQYRLTRVTFNHERSYVGTPDEDQRLGFHSDINLAMGSSECEVIVSEYWCFVTEDDRQRRYFYTGCNDISGVIDWNTFKSTQLTVSDPEAAAVSAVRVYYQKIAQVNTDAQASLYAHSERVVYEAFRARKIADCASRVVQFVRSVE